MGARFSNAILQTLLVLFSRRPPKNRRLLILATTSSAPILTDLGISDSFDANLRVPPITDLVAIKKVLTETQLFHDRDSLRHAIDLLENIGFAARAEDITESRKQVGIKKLLSMIEMARQEPQDAANRLASAIMEMNY